MEPLWAFFGQYLLMPLIIAIVMGRFVRHGAVAIFISVIPVVMSICLTIFAYSYALQSYTRTSYLDDHYTYIDDKKVFATKNSLRTTEQMIGSVQKCLEGDQNKPMPPEVCLKELKTGSSTRLLETEKRENVLVSTAFYPFLFMAILWPILSILILRFSRTYVGLEAAAKGLLLGAFSVGLSLGGSYVMLPILTLYDWGGVMFFFPPLIAGTYFVVGAILFAVYFARKIYNARKATTLP